MKKAFAYGRFSTDMQREESIDAQFRAIQDFCQKNDIQILKFYKDEGISGTTDSRPQFLEMIETAGELKENIDYIIVHKLDRFSRNRYDSAIYKRKLTQCGIRVLSVLENLDDSPESVILESVLEGMSEYFSKNLSREVKKGMYENAYNCKFNGGTPLFGYRIDENKNYVIHEYEAIAVRLIFDMFSKGATYTEIISKLDEMGYKTTKGNSFKNTTLYEMLSNERYIGNYIFSKNDYKLGDKKRNNHRHKKREDMIIIENGNPAIIDKETWQMVKDRQKINKMVSNKAKYTYLLSPILYCEECGRKISGITRKNSKGEIYHYYRCTNKNCNQNSVRTDKVERNLFEYFNKMIFQENNKKLLALNIQHFLENKTNTVDTIKIEDELKEIQKQLDNAIDFVLNGSNSSSIKNKIDELEQKKFNLENELFKVKNKIVKIDIEKITKFLNKYDKIEKYTIVEQQTILNFFLEKLEYSENCLKIVLKMCEKKNKISDLKDNENVIGFPAPSIWSNPDAFLFIIYKFKIVEIF